MTNPDVRPVWLTREQRDLLNDFLVTDVVAAWDAAPADAAEAVRAALADSMYTAGAGPVVLRALKAPGYGIPGDFDRKPR